MSAQPKYTCTRCLRVQAVASSCGLCGASVVPSTLRALSTIARLDPARALEAKTPPRARLRLVPKAGPADELEELEPDDADELEGPATDPAPAPRETPSAAPVAPRSGPRLVALDTCQPEDVVRRRVAWGAVDWMFGGGVPLERVIVVGGDPGLGKTTVVLGIVSRLGGPVLLVSTEGQTGPEIARMVRQTGGDASVVHVPAEEVRTIEDVARAAVELGAVAVVVDSVQGIELEERRQLAERDKYLIKLGTELAQALEAVVFYISQRAKDGTNLGSQKLPQLCGTVLELELRADGAIELYAPKKNRGGAVRRRAAFRFDDDSGALVPLEVVR